MNGCGLVWVGVVWAVWAWFHLAGRGLMGWGELPLCVQVSLALGRSAFCSAVPSLLIPLNHIPLILQKTCYLSKASWRLSCIQT